MPRRLSLPKISPQTFGELIKVFERSVEMLRQPYAPSGWYEVGRAPGHPKGSFESRRPGLFSVVDKEARGISVKLHSQESDLALWFLTANLLEGGDSERQEIFVPIPEILVIDSVLADENGRSI
jgi:hypothetical protein